MRRAWIVSLALLGLAAPVRAAEQPVVLYHDGAVFTD
jgi:phage baseplate assembly protein gpV